MKKILKHLLWVIPVILLVAVISLVAYAATARSTDRTYHARLEKTLQVTSSNFQNEEQIPVEFSCRGDARSPHIGWANTPDGTRSYALIAMDWDAPAPGLRLFPVVHWVLFNIPPIVKQISKGSTNEDLSYKRIDVGISVAAVPGYMAPCPPFGTHRYEFRVYALDVDRIEPASKDRSGVLQAMQGHILGYGELVGLSSPKAN